MYIYVDANNMVAIYTACELRHPARGINGIVEVRG